MALYKTGRNMFKFTKEQKKRHDEWLEKSKFTKKSWEESTKEKGSVYFIGELEPVKDKDDYYYAFKYIKIGYSIFPESRIKELQTGNPRELILLGVLSHVGSETESIIHKFLDSSVPEARQKGEWFRYDLIEEYLGLWLSSHKYSFYNHDQDLLDKTYVFLKYKTIGNGDLKVYHSYEKQRRIEALDPEKEEWMEKNTWGDNGRSVTSNKNYIDEFGDLITEGSDYYKIKCGSGYSDYLRLSHRSFKKMVDFIFYTGIQINIENLKHYYKNTFESKNLVRVPYGMNYQTFWTYRNEKLNINKKEK